jgi:hypothetical protein
MTNLVNALLGLGFVVGLIVAYLVVVCVGILAIDWWDRT